MKCAVSGGVRPLPSPPIVLLALAAAACSTTPSPSTTCGSGAAALAKPLLVLEHGDNTAGLARVSGGCLTETGADPALGNDQNLFYAGGTPFVGVNDDGSLRAVDPATLTITNTFPVYPDHGPSSIPHGIYGVAVDGSGDVWVSRDDVPEVAVLHADGTFVQAVDLGTLDPDPEHHPDMNGIYVHGGKAYVALGFLTHDPKTGGIISDVARYPGMLAVIDTATRMVTDKIPLHGHNPVHQIVPIDDTGDKVVVATPGQYATIDGGDGIDLVDLTTKAVTQLVSETALGGSVDQVAWGGPHEVYALTLGDASTDNATEVVVFDPATVGSQGITSIVQAPYFTDKGAAAYVHTALALDRDLVVVSDRTPGEAKIRLFPRALSGEIAPIVPAVQPPKGLLPY